MFKNIRFSLKKSKLLSKIRAEKQKKSSSYVEDLLNDVVKGKTLSKAEIKIEELLNLLYEDETYRIVLENHNAKISDVRKIIETLESNGAAQVVKGHYVPVSSIAFYDSLDLALSYWNKEAFKIEDLDAYNSNLTMSAQMIKSFE